MNLMLLKDFFQIFPDEESCIDYFRQIREDVGITCPKCGYTDHKWSDGRKAFQCKTCGYRTPQNVLQWKEVTYPYMIGSLQLT